MEIAGGLERHSGRAGQGVEEGHQSAIILCTVRHPEPLVRSVGEFDEDCVERLADVARRTTSLLIHGRQRQPSRRPPWSPRWRTTDAGSTTASGFCRYYGQEFPFAFVRPQNSSWSIRWLRSTLPFCCGPHPSREAGGAHARCCRLAIMSTVAEHRRAEVNLWLDVSMADPQSLDRQSVSQAQRPIAAASK
jgi:hypothetical protein